MSQFDNRTQAFMDATQGWDALDGGEGQFAIEQARQKEAILASAQLFEQCFSTEAGRQVLEILVKQTLDRVSWPATVLDDPQKLMIHGVHREGQNSVVALILNTIAIARNEETQREEF